MAWNTPEIYEPHLKDRVRDHVRRRREIHQLRIFWEWRMLEILCDEIDRLENELSDLKSITISDKENGV
jgi:hypothetical protein